MATGNVPSAVAGGYNTQVVSILDADPTVMNKLFRRHGDQGSGMFGMMKALGYTKGVSQETYSHFEEDWIHETIHHLAASATGGTTAGTACTIKLDTVDFDANDGFYVRKNQMLLLPNDVICTVTDVTVNGAQDVDVTFAPNDVSDNIDSAVVFATGGEEIMIFSNAWAEGSGQPGGIVSKTIKDSNCLQIIKETHDITGTEMNSKKYWTSFSDGRGLKGSHALGSEHAQYRFLMAINMALLWGKKTDNPLINGAGTGTNPDGLAFNTTEGCIPYIRRCGNTLDHSAGSWTVAKFDQMERILDREMEGGDLLMMMGLNLLQENSNVLKDYFSESNTDLISKMANDRLFGGNKGLTGSIDFSGFRKSNRNYYFQKMQVFSHPKLGGADQYTWADRAIAMPIGLRTVKDPTTGSSAKLPTFGCRYSKYDHGRMVQTWTTGAAGADTSQYTNQIDKKVLNYRAHVGFEGVAGNSMIVVEPA